MSTIYADIVTNANHGEPLILQNMPTGYVVSSTVIREDRSIQLRNYNNSYATNPSFIWGGEFTKYRADTNIVVTLTVFAIGFSDGNGACGVCLNRTHWDAGCAYQYDGQWDGVNQTTLVHGTHYFTAAQCPAGINRLDFGSNYQDNSRGSAFCWVLNGVAGIPTNASNAEGRLEGYVSTMHVYEIAP